MLLYDVATGERLSVLPSANRVNDVSFAFDGRLAASVGERQVGEDESEDESEDGNDDEGEDEDGGGGKIGTGHLRFYSPK